MLPSNAVLEPIPAEDAGPYNPAIVTDLAGLLASVGEQNPELDVSRYAVVLSLAQLGMKFVGERHNNNVNARTIQLMLERYSAGDPGAVDYVVVLTDVEVERDDGEKVMVRKHMRARFPKFEQDPPMTGLVAMSQEEANLAEARLMASAGEPLIQTPENRPQPNPDDAEPPKPGSAADDKALDQATDEEQDDNNKADAQKGQRKKR